MATVASSPIWLLGALAGTAYMMGNHPPNGENGILSKVAKEFEEEVSKVTGHPPVMADMPANGIA